MTPLPLAQDILAFLKKAGTAVSKRELIDAFRIRGDARIAFKRMLQDLESQGAIVKEDGKNYCIADGLPSVCVIEVTDIDIDGDVFAVPVDWDETVQGDIPRIEIRPDDKGHPNVKIRDRVLANLRRLGDDSYEAVILKRLDTPKSRVVGQLRQTKTGCLLIPMDRKARFDFDVSEADFNGAKPNMIVVAEVQPARGPLRRKARVIEVVGHADDPKAISLMAMHEMGLRPAFPDDVIAATKDMDVPPLGTRTDLRDIPLVTIDGADARDFDDAVFAEIDTDPQNKGGYHIVVAIADVAFYVRSFSALDKEAFQRGNSTYFPDRVVPMLPERLSNDLCSLRPHEPRATLAVHMWIDNQGHLLRHKFVRGLMLSRARLTYEQVQRSFDGNTDDTTQPLMETVIKPLYAAWKILDQARIKRGALDLDVPERKITVNDKGVMTGVAVRERLNSHRVIEEFMILANVAAAQALEAKKFPCIYRIHDRPTGDKLSSASAFLEAFGLHLPKGGVATPAQLNQLLLKAKDMKAGFLIHEIILRSQAQAVYSPDNIGHFGLALQKYAHFTSPIRRYADLIVHRALIAAYDLGEGGLDDGERVRLTEIAEHISSTERVSAEAERNAVDRFTARFLLDRLGSEMTGRIGGVTRFGLFIRLNDTAADGLVPIRTLPHDYYVHEEAHHALIGKRTGRVFRLGAPVLVRVVEADPLTGSTVLELVNGEDGAEVDGYKSTRGRSFRGKGDKRGAKSLPEERSAEYKKSRLHKKRNKNRNKRR